MLQHFAVRINTKYRHGILVKEPGVVRDFFLCKDVGNFGRGNAGNAFQNVEMLVSIEAFVGMLAVDDPEQLAFKQNGDGHFGFTYSVVDNVSWVSGAICHNLR